MLCTRSRVAAALNQDFGLALNFIDNAQDIIREILGYTLVDGESGPGGASNVGSINSTTVRDGVLHYYISSGMTGGVSAYSAVDYGVANLFASNPTALAGAQDLPSKHL